MLALLLQAMPHYAQLNCVSSCTLLSWIIDLFLHDLDRFADPMRSSLDTKTPNPRAQK